MNKKLFLIFLLLSICKVNLFACLSDLISGVNPLRASASNLITNLDSLRISANILANSRRVSELVDTLKELRRERDDNNRIDSDIIEQEIENVKINIRELLENNINLNSQLVIRYEGDTHHVSLGQNNNNQEATFSDNRTNEEVLHQSKVVDSNCGCCVIQ